MEYKAPVEDMLFLMKSVAGLAGIARLPGYGDASDDMAAAILTESARYCEQVVAPLNAAGDRTPAQWHADGVKTTPGYADAYRQYREAGWQGLQHTPAYGGQGLPRLIAAACTEMLNAANLSFALCPLLTDGAIEALMTAGSETQRQLFLPRLISGEWTGTMNLTEPQAGSDLAQVRTRAVPEPVSSGAVQRYRLFGTKIFITYGEHDLAENIVHMVLARLPDAPPGVKGISLFIVPKWCLDEQGGKAARNDVQCVSLEHKLGIHGSPTAVLQFGDHGGALGEMLGAPNRGLETMFIMMNAARFGVGVQGIGMAERAFQAARGYALERVQGRSLDGQTGAGGKPRAIIGHPDVRRMLMTMRSLTEGARALAFVAAAANDLGMPRHGVEADKEADEDADKSVAGATLLHKALDPAHYRSLNEYLVPIVKGWSTEMAVEVASLAVQVHGGMGFIEETGVAQYYRDARILPIYEGTTAIQANDLVGRKTVRDNGATAFALLHEIDHTVAALQDAAQDLAADSELHTAFASMATQLQRAREAYAQVVTFIVAQAATDPVAVYAGSVPYLKLAGIVLSGWLLARSALVAQSDAAPAFAQRKCATARFFAEHVLPQACALQTAIVSAKGTAGVLSLPDDLF